MVMQLLVLVLMLMLMVRRIFHQRRELLGLHHVRHLRHLRCGRRMLVHHGVAVHGIALHEVCSHIHRALPHWQER